MSNKILTLQKSYKSQKTPFVFYTEDYTENSAKILFNEVIQFSEEVFHAVYSTYSGTWGKNPSRNNERALLGLWMTNSFQHYLACIELCKMEKIPKAINVHFRQIFEIFIQAKFYSRHNYAERVKIIDQIYIIGCLDYLDKMKRVASNENISKGTKEISEKLNLFDEEAINDVKMDRKKKKFNWFKISYAKLCEEVSDEKEDLAGVYQILSSEVHGTSDLVLNVNNPAPGQLDFRGYSDEIELMLNISEKLDLTSHYFLNLWNTIAGIVGGKVIIIK